MVEDRYAVNKPLYTLGMLCLICALALLMFALYIVPRLLWGLHYDVPGFVTEGQVWFQEEWLWSQSAANWTMFAIFFVPGVLLACISDWVSKRIESQMPELPVKPILAEAHQASRKNRVIVLQLVSVILLIVCGFWLLNLMLS